MRYHPATDRDLERDTPTTAVDVEVLRQIRKQARPRGPVNLRPLDASQLPVSRPPTRSFFPDMPPFEL